MPESREKPNLNPTALPLEEAARLLAALGKRPISVEMLRADIDAGAPLNTDGTLNLVAYAAWLVRESVDRSPEPAGARHGHLERRPTASLRTPDSKLRTDNGD